MNNKIADPSEKILQNCHEEELRFFHRVQKFSYFIAFDKETHIITAISDNLIDFLQLDRLHVFEQKVGAILSKKTLDDLMVTIQDYEGGVKQIYFLCLLRIKKRFMTVSYFMRMEIYI